MQGKFDLSLKLLDVENKVKFTTYWICLQINVKKKLTNEESLKLKITEN